MLKRALKFAKACYASISDGKASFPWLRGSHPTYVGDGFSALTRSVSILLNEPETLEFTLVILYNFRKRKDSATREGGAKNSLFLPVLPR